MLRKISMGFLILVMAFVLTGCGGTANPKAQEQNKVADQTPTKEAPKTEYLTPIPAGKPLGESNIDLSKQIMSQKDVLGTQIYEQKGMTYGDITFKSEVDKTYAHKLITEFMTQMKTNYPGKPITTQAISDGKPFDSVTFKP